jgi:hemoglobin
MTERPPLFERVGGERFFIALVDRFYNGVRTDPTLRPLYAEADESLPEARRWLTLFLIQYWGGPPTYAAERGHPRLRMRHFPFAIGEEERNAWFGHMSAAVEAGGLPDAERAELLNYFASAADFMVNR